MANRNDDLAYLRKHIDGSDQFMGGHQVLTVRKSRQRKPPEWVNNDKIVQNFLVSQFPNYRWSWSEYTSLRVWAAVIYLYLRVGMKARDVAHNLNHRQTGPISETITQDRIWRIAYSIKKAYAGERTDGKPRTGNKVGRPKKKL
jgi:hypothetical protein